MSDKKLDLFVVAVIFLLGFVLGRYTVPVDLPDYAALSADEIQDGLDVYAACMESVSRTGCRISFDNFAVYHDLKREQRRRARLALE